ncbi:TPR-like protein [Laetiporus sulphureus 93-53]|uniref:TPR-like protein n=1 Tax=Laetiporus sulphureus 93-53 TaxID=1314785 RepID=A0A165DJX5_9APHY|nr:TPR-like protein [Laetiporus sulphureus 93-53]KZT05046.1 TPR-like protein [Laetiporus sulphureus 93-53]
MSDALTHWPLSPIEAEDDVSEESKSSDLEWESDDSKVTASEQSESQQSEEEEEEEEEEDAEAEGAVADNGGLNAEVEIEGDFDRLVQSIRGADGGSSTGILSRMWNVNLEEKEAEFRDDLREASGVGRRKVKKRARRSGPVLSPQVRILIGEGNQAYVDNDIPETIRIMQEVIRIEPHAVSAWSVLAQCYADMNEPQKELQLRIMAAHLDHDEEVWRQLAKRSLELGLNQQALYCYGKAYRLDATAVDVLWDRAMLAKEVGELKIARDTFLMILKRYPHDLTVLDEIRPILIELSDLERCASLFEACFAHYQSAFPTGLGYDHRAEKEVPGGGFGLMQLLVLADLYNTLGQYEKAIETIRNGCRWLQGRSQQRFWDVCEDDREYDVIEGLRGTEGALQPGMYPLDVNARHRLAVSRIKMGDIEEGKIHANIVLSQDVTEYAPLFGEIADAYFERELYAEAGRIYEILGGDAGTSSLYVLMQAAVCRRMVGDIKEAAEVYEHVISADPTNNEAKMKLAEIYEITGETRKAFDLVMQVIDSRKRRQRQGAAEGAGETLPTTSLFDEKSKPKGKAAKAASKVTFTQLRELEAEKEREVVQGFHRIKELWPRVMVGGEEEAEREWLVEAEKLVESFRETRPLFLTSRHQGFRGMFPRSSRKQTAEASEESMASRLQLELGRGMMAHKVKSEGINPGGVETFRTVSFEEWLRLFLHYTFQLTKQGRYEEAQEILRHITYSNAYQSRVAQDAIRLALITCSVHAGNYQIAVEQSRKLINAYQFNNEPLRVLVASLGSGLRPTDAFLVSTLTKHLLRELKLGDMALKNKDALRWNHILRRYGQTGGQKAGDAEDVDEDDIDEVAGEGAPTAVDKSGLPTKGNPVSIAVYGQICLAARSYQSALFYLLHAYDYCPDDPMICLCTAIASFGRAMQRQADNRNHLITQGMAFLSRYRAIRGVDSDGMDEVEYNFGRVFQQLGLHSLAVRHYERVLELAENRTGVNDEDYGLAREAAYNLSLIYVTTGATPLAENLYRRWLSL